MVDGAVVFHGNVGYDFYIVRKEESGEYDIKCIQMPRAGESHKKLSDEIIIAFPRAEDNPQTLVRRVIDAYENLMYGQK